MPHRGAHVRFRGLFHFSFIHFCRLFSSLFGCKECEPPRSGVCFFPFSFHLLVVRLVNIFMCSYCSCCFCCRITRVSLCNAFASAIYVGCGVCGDTVSMAVRVRHVRMHTRCVLASVIRASTDPNTHTHTYAHIFRWYLESWKMYLARNCADTRIQFKCQTFIDDEKNGSAEIALHTLDSHTRRGWGMTGHQMSDEWPRL